MSHRDTILALLADGGIKRHRDLKRAGVTAAAIERLVARGEIVRVETLGGVLLGYRKADQEPVDITPEGLEGIALRIPGAVLCLHSAARLWRLTDEYAVEQVAAVPPGVNRTTRTPGVKLILWTNPAMFHVGVVEHQFAGVLARVTDPARTVADFFRPRHQQPLEDAMKALGLLVARDGEDALNRVEEYAWALGWGASVTTATRAFRETFHVHAPQR